MTKGECSLGGGVHTNTIEGYFSIFKRACSERFPAGFLATGLCGVGFVASMRRRTSSSLGRSVSVMARDPKSDWYWPLGELEYQHEIREFFPEEAEALGIITILWNRQELKLRHLYLLIIASKRPAYAEAIWDRQPTHQARRDLLALALHTVKLSKRHASILSYIIDKTKTVADRRNELLHAEYVVHGRTDKLHAKVKAPRSSKPPKHQKATTTDLQTVINDLEHLIMATEAAWLEFGSRKTKRFVAALGTFAKERGLFQGNRQSDSDLPSLRQTHGEEF